MAQPESKRPEPIEAQPVKPPPIVDYKNPRHVQRAPRFNGWVVLGMVASFIGLPIALMAIANAQVVSSYMPELIIGLLVVSVGGVVLLLLLAKARGSRTLGGSLVGGLFGGVLLWAFFCIGGAALLLGICFFAS